MRKSSLGTLMCLLSSDRNRRGRQFELVVAQMLRTEPRWADQLVRADLWSDAALAWSTRDKGVDVLCEAKDRTLWAVQCKAYARQTTVTKEDVDTFLSDSARPQVSYRLLVATTDRLSANAEDTIAGQEKPVGFLNRTALEALDVDWVRLAVAAGVLNDAKGRLYYLPAAAATRAAPVAAPTAGISVADPAWVSPTAGGTNPARARAAGPGPVHAERPAPPTPAAHQQAALADLRHGFTQHDRGQLVMACGTGKTLTGMWAAQQQQAHTVLLLFPSLTLLAETLSTYTRYATLDFLVVCSDETVMGKGARDEARMDVSELGVPVTTDVRHISDWLQLPGDGRQRVVFATYQSSPRVAQAFTESAMPLPPFDMVIADEAHRCTGHVSSAFATVLDNQQIPARKRLFMTATPRVVTAGHNNRSAAQVASMNDEALFGPVLHRLGMPQAIRAGLLAEYQVVISVVDDEQLSRMVRVGRAVEAKGLAEGTDARHLASAAALLQAMGEHDLRRVISFHSSVKAAQKFESLLPQVAAIATYPGLEAESLRADHINGTQPTSLRRSKLSRLRELEPTERRVVTNVQCCSEGVDVPSLDAVAFIDPRSSVNEIIQAIGRAIRGGLADPANIGKIGTVFIPVAVPADQTIEQALAGSAFNTVVNVVAALRSHDEDLAQDLEALSSSMAYQRRRRTDRGEIRAPKRLQLNLPASLGSDDVSRLMSAITTAVVSRTTLGWSAQLGELMAFADAHGHAGPHRPHPQDCTCTFTAEDRKQLCKFVKAQRAARRRDEIEPERIALLDALPHFCWDGELELLGPAVVGLLRALPGADREAENLSALLPHGLGQDPPSMSPSECANHLRRLRSDAAVPGLLADPFDRVPSWCWAPPTLATSFETFPAVFTQLEGLRERTGSAIPDSSLTGGTAWSWLNWLNGMPTDEVPDHVRMGLVDLGVAMDEQARIRRMDADAVIHLRSYVAEHWHCDVPLWVTQGGFRLGRYVQELSVRWAQGTLDKDVQATLQCAAQAGSPDVPISFEFSGLSRSFTTVWPVIEEHLTVHGHADVASDLVVQDQPVGQVVHALRRAFTDGCLQSWIHQACEEHPKWAWQAGRSTTFAWQGKHERLRAFLAAEGHAMLTDRRVRALDSEAYFWGRYLDEVRDAGPADPRWQDLSTVDGFATMPAAPVDDLPPEGNAAERRAERSAVLALRALGTGEVLEVLTLADAALTKTTGQRLALEAHKALVPRAGELSEHSREALTGMNWSPVSLTDLRKAHREQWRLSCQADALENLWAEHGPDVALDLATQKYSAHLWRLNPAGQQRARAARRAYVTLSSSDKVSAQVRARLEALPGWPGTPAQSRVA
jgi:superfamily II DNA or RNA helicase